MIAVNSNIKNTLRCFICGEDAAPLYHDAHDYTFGVSGHWSYIKCANNQCATIQLNPLPTSETIKTFYSGYYTQSVDPESLIELDQISSAPSVSKKGILKLFLSNLLFWRSDQYLSDLRYLASRKTPGKLLDVGCGNGLFLKAAKNRGWEVEGCDYDQKSVEVANKTFDLDVKLGDLQSISYESNRFDAITLSNVIEHLTDPLSLMIESYRILNDGGRFVSVSPNPSSVLHKRYGKYWRGLEPPRHIMLLQHQTLHNLAKRAGFKKVFSFTSVSGLELSEASSQEILRKANDSDIYVPPLSKAFILALTLATLLGSSRGEYCVLIADK
jgi:2-polyprenyl-3-methyl-5-hydroxy-6-metoxy-1,4-benzoquinol methylase